MEPDNILLMMPVTGLYSRVCNYDNLWLAWLMVKRKGSTGGIDNISVNDFDKNAQNEINRLQEELTQNEYVPRPYQRAYIPKDSKKNRTLGLLSVRDKIVQQAVYFVVYPIIDKHLSSSCCAYRQGKGAIKAVRKVQHCIKHEGYAYTASCDIKSYFDNIPHSTLFGMVQKIIPDRNLVALIELCLGMGSVKRGNVWVDNIKGIPQGGVISPILANLFLTPLDKAILEKSLGYVRYADDFVILTKDYKEAESSVQIVNDILSSLELEFKENPTIKNIEEGFSFLGIDFFKNKIRISDIKRERISEKIETAFLQPKHNPTATIIKVLNGYRAFYGKLFSEVDLEFIDLQLAECIRKRAENEGIKKEKDLHAFFEGFSFLTRIYDKKRPELFKKIISETTEDSNQLKQKTARQIAKRKRQYQKLESENKELIINSYGTFLGSSEGKILVKQKDKKGERIPTSNLAHVTILTNGMSLSSDFIYHCIKSDIPVSFFTKQGQHFATLYSPLRTDCNLWQKQLEALKSEKGLKVAAWLINAKIRNQANLLKYFHKYHKNADQGFAKMFKEKIEKLIFFSKKINHEVLSNNDKYREILLGQEAQAAGIYWSLVAELINDDSDFTQRERKGAKDLVNSLLNYGYAILYARVWEALLAARLNPNISYLHVSSTSKPTLAFDLIEVFRQQAVDRVVITMLQKKEKLEVKDGLLSDETRAKLTRNIYERLHRPEKFRGENRRLSEIIKIQARALASYINDEAAMYKPYISKW